jgi:hypothetical protein
MSNLDSLGKVWVIIWDNVWACLDLGLGIVLRATKAPKQSQTEARHRARQSRLCSKEKYDI